MVTVLLFGLIYMNYLLLGDYFVCFFLALLTSVYLLEVKERIINHVVLSFNEPWKYTKNTFVCQISIELLQMLVDGNFNKTFERMTLMIDRRFAQRKKDNHTMFNNANSVAWLLVMYVGFVKLGILNFAQLAF